MCFLVHVFVDSCGLADPVDATLGQGGVRWGGVNAHVNLQHEHCLLRAHK